MKWRDIMCGEPRVEHVGSTVTVAGWAARRRDHGGLVFVDLRDDSGLLQLVVNPERSPKAAEVAKEIRNEYVLRATGAVVARSAETVNPKMATGAIEIQVDELEIVSRSTPLPFQLDEEGVDETLRLRYRWLDLRRDRLHRNLTLRARLVSTIRQVMESAGFQIAICFRDEDLRADRVQEITQLDVELAFPDTEFILALMEEMCREVWRECIGVELEPPFRRMTYDEAMLRYGTDKPDLRYQLEIADATEVTRVSEFGVFANARAVRFLSAPQAFSRLELERLEEVARRWGAKGLAYLVFDEEGEVRSPIAKFLSEPELDAFRGEPGSTALFCADEPKIVARVLGALREHLARELDLVAEEAFEFAWITDFPMFEWSEEERRWGAMHHPFTRPTLEWEDRFDEDPAGARALAYDLVANGNEIGGGSLRMHEPDLQARVFGVLQMSPEEQRAKFGFLLDALAMGAPPHGGIAFGIDRMMMVVAREPNLRDVIAFPKNQAGVDPMSGAPSEVSAEQLQELGIRLLEEPT